LNVSEGFSLITGTRASQKLIFSGLLFLLVSLFVVAAASAADPSTGTLIVQSTPSGATVSIDGTVAGTTPFTSSTVTAGDRSVSLTLAGYETYVTTVTVPAGGSVTGIYTLVAVVPVTTTPASTGTMIIRSTPAGASVSVDGTLKGTAPYTSSSVPAGDHTILLTLAGYGDFPSTVTVPAGGTFQEIYTMPVNILTISSNPAGASLYLDGTLKGTTPKTFNAIVAGGHTVTLKLTGYNDLSTTVTVTGGTEVTRDYTMAAASTVTTTGTVSTTVPATSLVTTASTTVAATAATTAEPLTTETTQYAAIRPSACLRHFTGAGKLEAGTSGGLNCTTILVSDDSVATIRIQKGTFVTDAAGRTVSDISAEPVNTSGIPQSGTGGPVWTGHAYRFRPEQTAFNPEFQVNFTLSQAEWDGLDPSSLTIRQTTANGTGWEDLPTAVYPATRTLGATASRFSTLGLFSASPAASPTVSPQPVPTATPAAPVPKGSLPLSPYIPDKLAPLAAISAGILVCAAGTLAQGSSALSGAGSRISSLFQDFMGSETIDLINDSEIEKRGINPTENQKARLFSLSTREIWVIGFSTLGFAVAFILQDRLEWEPATVIIYVCAAGISTILFDIAHKHYASRAGCITEYQVWGLGSATMLSTAWLFGNAFAKPSRTIIRGEEDLTPKNAAIIKMAGPMVSLALAVVSLALIPLGGLLATAGEAVFSMNLLNCVYSLLPVKPNDGVEVYAWNKLVWGILFVPLIVVYLYYYMLM
jgi:hypothetical protein